MLEILANNWLIKKREKVKEVTNNNKKKQTAHINNLTIRIRNLSKEAT